MGATRRRLNPKSLKNYQNTKYTNQNENFPKKNYVSSLKSLKEPKISIRATRQNLQAQLKMSEHQINQLEQKLSQKKYV
jgi:hypothetical protein